MKGLNFVRGADVITDPVQAGLLSDAKSTAYLEPFIAAERSASEAAQEIGCRLDTLLYRISKFMAAGLLNVVRLEPRRGRPIKIYKSSADAYFVPFAATPYADFEEALFKTTAEQAARLIPNLAKTLRTTGFEGRLIYRNPDDGQVWHTSGDHPDAPEATPIGKILEGFLGGRDVVCMLEAYHGPLGTDFFVDLHLTRPEAKAFLQRLYELWRDFSFTAEADGSREPYQLSVTFVKDAAET